MSENTLLNAVGESSLDQEGRRPKFCIDACAGPLSDTRHANPLFLTMLELARKTTAQQ